MRPVSEIPRRAPILLVGLLLVGLLLGQGSCGSPSRPPRETEAERAAPTWLALGHEVYRYSEAPEARRRPLALRDEPRWFRETAPASGPARLGEVPVRDRGAHLELELGGVGQADVTIRLTLHAGRERLLWRAVEHRWTTVTPFLFGLYADGEPVMRPIGGFGKIGGIQRFTPLVTAAADHVWTLRIERASLARLLPTPAPRQVELVAAFCERQCFVRIPAGVEAATLPVDPDLRAPFEGEPVLVRSRLLRIPLSL